MKYNYLLTKIYSDHPIQYSISLLHGENGNYQNSINSVLMMMNQEYVNYYISLIEGKKTPFEINVSESFDGEMSDYLLVEGENVYFEGDRNGETLETSELLEFLKIMKKELNIGEEMIVDKRVEPNS